MKIYAKYLGGNVHEAAIVINHLDLAEWLVEIHTLGHGHSGKHATGVFKVPDELYAELIKK